MLALQYSDSTQTYSDERESRFLNDRHRSLVLPGGSESPDDEMSSCPIAGGTIGGYGPNQAEFGQDPSFVAPTLLSFNSI